jgi:hypothetical protein
MRPRYAIAVLATAAIALVGCNSAGVPSTGSQGASSQPTPVGRQSPDTLIAAAPTGRSLRGPSG